jgi:D-3-phosphoglycerate dehydrogenase
MRYRPHIGAASLDVIRETGRSVLDHLAEAFAGSPRDVVAE